ncbi:hypothetical protein HHB90_10970, partial [Neisseria meningitidis]|nr:hypothetical protein [Neisseria meningitidis]
MSESGSGGEVVVTGSQSLLVFVGDGVSLFAGGDFRGVSWEVEWDTTAEDVTSAFGGLLDELGVFSVGGDGLVKGVDVTTTATQPGEVSGSKDGAVKVGFPRAVFKTPLNGARSKDGAVKVWFPLTVVFSVQKYLGASGGGTDQSQQTKRCVHFCLGNMFSPP